MVPWLVYTQPNLTCAELNPRWLESSFGSCISAGWCIATIEHCVCSATLVTESQSIELLHLKLARHGIGNCVQDPGRAPSFHGQFHFGTRRPLAGEMNIRIRFGRS